VRCDKVRKKTAKRKRKTLDRPIIIFLVAGFVFFERGAKKTIIKREREREDRETIAKERD